MTSPEAERAREIVEAWLDRYAPPNEISRESGAALVEAIAAALAAQADARESGLHSYRGTAVSCEEYERLIVAPLRGKAAQTRALGRTVEDAGNV